ncbi:MAG: hypothetical protein D6743_17085 [Calditrichaeota bacterium]|nr:MAG: hypothetical protein D6743_17085 [Calditrichota bacterium]
MAKMEKNDWLQQAEQHLFHLPPADIGAALCLENMKYGLAKLHFVQHALGLKPDATFIASPDVTVTINSYRWNNGFGYGGKLAWGDGEHELIFLDTKPNCCGMIVGGLERLPSKEALIQRSVAMKREHCEVEGIRIKWNLEKGNHFVDVFEVRPLEPGIKLPPYAFMAHTSGSELKKESHLGPGLYIDASETLKSWAEVVATPYGPANVLTGRRARDYFEFYAVAETFARKRRERAAQLLFDDFTTLTNANHQGLLNLNEIALGINTWHGTPGETLHPLALRPDLPAYLFKGVQNFSTEMIKALGWEARAQRLGVYHRLKDANMLPHGAGYNYPGWKEVVRTHEVDGRRYFEVASKNGAGTEIVNDLRNVPYEYRGKEVCSQTIELGLGKPVAELVPIYVLKI